jgi:hypothetical protein
MLLIEVRYGQVGREVPTVTDSRPRALPKPGTPLLTVREFNEDAIRISRTGVLGADR